MNRGRDKPAALRRPAAGLVAAVAVLLSILNAARANAFETAARSLIQIPPQALTSALQIFGRLQGLRIVFVSEDLANAKSAGVHGTLTDEEALRALTRGTGLIFEFLDARTVSILPPRVPHNGTPLQDTAANVQPPPAGHAESPPPLNEITVTSAGYPVGEALKLKTLQYVSLHSVRDSRSSRLPRWYRPICLLTMGLSDDRDAFVSARIEEIAKSAGAPVQPGSVCNRANVEILFSAEPEKLMSSIANRFQGALGFPYISQIRQRTADPDAVQSWYATASRKRFGDGALGSSNGWRADHASDPDPNMVTGTRLPPDIEIALVNALVVIDTRKIAGHKLGSLADYIAMLVLSRAKAADICDGLPTIFDLMSKGCASISVEALTPSDEAFLKGLYAANLDGSPAAAIADIAGRMYLEIEAEQGAGLPQ
jgi:hypothetical protein